jgi:cullin 3
MLIKLGAPLRDNKEVYQQDFEHSFLMTSKTFYHEESLKYLTENTCPAYMKKAEDRLVEEKNRVSRYLHESTGPKLMRIVEGALIYRHAQSLVDMENSGCIDMFRNNKIDDLARLYRLFNRVSSMFLRETRPSLAHTLFLPPHFLSLSPTYTFSY